MFCGEAGHGVTVAEMTDKLLALFRTRKDLRPFCRHCGSLMEPVAPVLTRVTVLWHCPSNGCPEHYRLPPRVILRQAA